MDKLIGVCPRVLNYGNKELVFVNNTYLHYLESATFKVLILPLRPSTDLLDKFYGFLIPGGDDIDPKYFNESLHNKTVLSGEEVDLTDLMVIKYAIAKKKPLYGICRGLQIINVVFDGTLNQDMEHHIQNGKLINHNIKLINGRLFKSNRKIVVVNSAHHQSINKLGKGLKAIGVSSDGVIEIIEHEYLPILAVQFHPELLIDNDLSSQLLTAFQSLFK